MRRFELNSAGDMVFTFGGKVSGMGFFWAFENTKSNSLFGYANSGHPSLMTFVNAKKPRAVISSWFAKVLNIVRVRYVAKVCNSVIGRITVHVVNFAFRKRPVAIEPSKPMRFMLETINFDVPVAVFMEASSDISGFDSVGCSYLPGEESSVRVVQQQGFQSLNCKVGIATTFSQISDAKVIAVSTDKNNLCFWPYSIAVKPCKVTQIIRVAINDYGSGLGNDGLSYNPRVRAFWSVDLAGKCTSFWVVVKKLFKPILGESRIVFSHDAPRLLIGQRPDSVPSGFWPCYFNTRYA